MVSEISHRPDLEASFQYFKELLKGVSITCLNFSTKVIPSKETPRTDWLESWGSYTDEKKKKI